MSLNISVKFLRIAKPVYMDIDLTLLGKNQMKKLLKTFRSRVILTGGISTSIAYAYFEEKDIGYFSIGKGSYFWNNIDHDEWVSLQPKVEAVAVEASLDPDVQEQSKEYAQYSWSKDRPSPLQTLLNGLNNKESKVSTKWGASRISELLKLHIKKLSPHEHMEELAKRIERGEVTTLSVKAKHLY